MGDEFNNLEAWEDAWKQAFEDSEHTPPKRVWQGLENSLMEQQLRQYKRKLVVYQWLAAASVVFLGLWAGWWLLLANPQLGQEGIAAGNLQQSDPFSSGQTAAWQNRISPAATDIPAGASQNNGETGNLPEGQSASRKTVQHSSGSPVTYQPSAPVVAGQSGNYSIFQPIIIYTDLSRYYLPVYADQAQADTESTVGHEMVMLLPDPNISAVAADWGLRKAEINKEIRVVASHRRKAKNNSEFLSGDVWVGLSLASNFFDPNMSNADKYRFPSWPQKQVSGKGGSEVYTANVTSWDEKEKSLPSIDFSLDAGYRLSPRWMLQSSLLYGTYKVNTLSGSYTDPSDQKSYPLYYSNFSYDKLQVTRANSRRAMPVNAVNTYKFFSVPVTFSYILTEQVIGLAVKSGVSADFFLGGKIHDEENRLEAYTIGAGPDSPFQRVHFNALFGAQLFYRAGPNYLITIEPTYRYAITGFNKKSSLFDSRPTQFGVSAGFRFILR